MELKVSHYVLEPNAKIHTKALAINTEWSWDALFADFDYAGAASSGSETLLGRLAKTDA